MARPVESLRVFACDLETTVYKGQTYTEAWAASFVELNTEDAIVMHSLGDMIDYFLSLNSNLILYFHNLAFDGAFILSYLLNHDWKQARNEEGWFKIKNMPHKTLQYSISDQGKWYTITLRYNKKTISIRDSLKLIPFSLKKIGKDFGTKHKKLEMKYEGFRYAGCEITNEEEAYIKNDVLVLKEALEIMFASGHNKLTIGSCCMEEFKSFYGREDYELFFPDLKQIPIDNGAYAKDTAWDYVNDSYQGGWCYVVEGKECKIYHNGITADVNSLYPSVMHSSSGNRYPVGKPVFWKGDIPKEALKDDRYYFIKVKTRFYLKKGYLPFIHIRKNLLYKATECLKTSDVKYGDEYLRAIEQEDGTIKQMIPTLTLTKTDWELMQEHYDLEDTEILSGCWFRTEIGLFDAYINKYREQKINSKGAKRTEAKLFLNNLYGKMATNENSSYKVVELDEDGVLVFTRVPEQNKKVGYIPIGSAITSYARKFTITAAQKNYYGVNRRGFIYADTDSIHCDLSPDELKGIPVHPTEFNHWKLEASWDMGYFTRAKTYIEHIVAEDLEPIAKPYYNVKCAGMPERSKQYFIRTLENHLLTEEEENDNEIDDNVKEFLKKPRTITDFKVGLSVPGKLLPKHIKGGIVLKDTPFVMRRK